MNFGIWLLLFGSNLSSTSGGVGTAQNGSHDFDRWHRATGQGRYATDHVPMRSNKKPPPPPAVAHPLPGKW